MNMAETRGQIQLAASMLCADPGRLREDILQLNQAGVNLMHVDIMDGHFVPNMTGGLDVANCIRQYAQAPCDFHLMVEEPEYLINALQLQPDERICFHIENAKDPDTTIAGIQATGAKVGIAMNPGTPISAVTPYITSLDYLLVLIVNPGFKGQSVIPQTLDKLRRLRELRDEQGLNLRLFVDGAVTLENIMEIVEAGADDLVCGPFTCFNQALGGIESTLALVKSKLLENGCQIMHNSRGGMQK